MFDTLVYANKLKEAGFTEKQAGAQAEALASVVDSNLATKTDIELVRRDIKELEAALKRDMKELEMATKTDIELVRRDIKALEAALKRDMKELELATKTDIELVRRDMKVEIELVRRDMKEMELKFEGQFVLLKWMLGVVMAGILSLVLKAFFVA